MNRKQVDNLLRRELVRARLRKGIKQADLAKGIGRSQSFISKFEGGTRALDVTDFISICSELDLDPSSLVRQIKNS